VSLLEIQGAPEEAAQRLLDSAIAPEASGKVATLLEAFGEMRGTSGVFACMCVCVCVREREKNMTHSHVQHDSLTCATLLCATLISATVMFTRFCNMTGSAT